MAAKKNELGNLLTSVSYLVYNLSMLVQAYTDMFKKREATIEARSKEITDKLVNHITGTGENKLSPLPLRPSDLAQIFGKKE